MRTTVAGGVAREIGASRGVDNDDSKRSGEDRSYSQRVYDDVFLSRAALLHHLQVRKSYNLKLPQNLA